MRPALSMMSVYTPVLNEGLFPNEISNLYKNAKSICTKTPKYIKLNTFIKEGRSSFSFSFENNTRRWRLAAFPLRENERA